MHRMVVLPNLPGACSGSEEQQDTVRWSGSWASRPRARCSISVSISISVCHIVLIVRVLVTIANNIAITKPGVDTSGRDAAGVPGSLLPAADPLTLAGCTTMRCTRVHQHDFSQSASRPRPQVVGSVQRHHRAPFAHGGRGGQVAL